MSRHHRKLIYLRLQQVPDALLFGINDYESTRTQHRLETLTQPLSASRLLTSPMRKKKDLHSSAVPAIACRTGSGAWRWYLEVQRMIDTPGPVKKHSEDEHPCLFALPVPCQGWTAKDQGLSHFYMSKDGCDGASRRVGLWCKSDRREDQRAQEWSTGLDAVWDKGLGITLSNATCGLFQNSKNWRWREYRECQFLLPWVLLVPQCSTEYMLTEV